MDPGAAFSSLTISAIHDNLRKNLPQTGSGPTSDAFISMIEHYVYLASNNVVRGKVSEERLKRSVKCRLRWAIENLLKSQTPTTLVFSCKLLVTAARLDYAGVLRILVDSCILQDPLRWPTLCTPVSS
jgi:hypothetical protein